MTRPVFTYRIVAPPDAIDELRHVNNAVWVQWIQEVALAHWYSIADPAHQDDYIWVVVRHEIDYLRAVLDEDGRLAPFRDQDSSLLTIFSRANALVRRMPNAPAEDAGAAVDYLPFGG